MPQWAGSCWYYLRFCDPHNDKRFVGEEAERYWMGGDKPGGVRGVEGVAGFVVRVWRLLMTENQAGEWELSSKVKPADPSKAQQKVLHATIKKVTKDIESFSFNTAISQMMIFVNAFTNV